MDWKKLLGSITESVDEELRLRNAYLTVENRLLRQQRPGRLPLCDSDGKALAAIGKQLGRKAMAEVATIAQPDTILAWYRTLVVQQCESIQPRKSAGRPPLPRRSRMSWYGWPARTARGAMTALSEPPSISAMP